MVQTKRKTNLIALAIVLSLVFVFALVAALFATPATETAYAIDDVAQFHFYGLSNYGGSKTDGGITFSYSGNYYIPGGTSCVVLESGGSFTVTVSNSALNNKNITKVKYTLTQDYASGAGEGSISVRLRRGSTSKSTSMQTSSSGVSISGSGDLTFTLTNNSTSDRSKAYRFSVNFTLMAPSQVAVTASVGTGVKEVFLSSAQNGSPAAASGSTFAEGSTVYAFAKLAKGYQAKSGWTLISGNADSEDAVYRTGSKTISTSNKDFGTITADIKTRVIALNGNGGENGTDVTLTYGEAKTVDAISRDGYNFLGWNTNAEGTGATYGTSLSAEQVNAILDDASITAFYAMWKAEINTVIAYINAIGEVEYTQACKDKIDAARALYDSLDTADQAQVNNNNYGILTDAEDTYNAMHDDKEALDTYKTEKKTDADDLALEGDSAACEDLIAEAKTDIDAVVYDCTKTLDENKAVVDAILANLADALALQRDKDAFEAYKVPSKEAADALALESDSAACEDLIAGAKAEIEDLDYDEDLTLDENKAIIDEIVADLADALALQRDKEAFEAYKTPKKEAADELAEAGDSAACEDLIAGAKAEIEDLDYDEDLTLDENKDAVDAIVNELTNALTAQRNNEAAAAAVSALIDAIEVPVTLAEEDAIVAAKEAFDALTSAQKDLVTNEEKLFDAIIALMEAYINAIPDPVVYTTACGDKIAKARDFFDDLTEAEQALVENKQDLLDAEAAYKELDDAAKANAAKALIEAIGEVEDTQSSKDKIDAAREAYDALTADQKALIAEDAPTIVTAETTYNTLHNNNLAAAEVIALIEAIGEVEDTQDSKEKIDAAKEAYDALTDDQKALITEDAPTIVTAETTYNTLHNNNLAAQEVIALIEQIGTVEYTDTSKNKIDTAKEAYNDLTDAQKAIVDGYLTENEVDTIVVSETVYIGLGDQQKAQEVKDLIVAIGEVKYPDSKDKIEAAREGYDGLTDAQKPLVDNYETLTTAETTYAGLEAQANKKLSGGAIAGIVIACVVFVCGLCVLVLFLLKKKQDKEGARPAPVYVVDDEPKDDQTDELEG